MNSAEFINLLSVSLPAHWVAMVTHDVVITAVQI